MTLFCDGTTASIDTRGEGVSYEASEPIAPTALPACRGPHGVHMTGHRRRITLAVHRSSDRSLTATGRR
jgi:hypothetical protein